MYFFLLEMLTNTSGLLSEIIETETLKGAYSKVQNQHHQTNLNGLHLNVLLYI